MNKAKEFIANLKKAHAHSTEGVWHTVAVSGNSEYAPYYGVTSSEDGRFPDVVHANSDWEGFGNGSSLPNALFISEAHEKVPVILSALETIIKAVEDNGSVTKEEIEEILVLGDISK